MEATHLRSAFPSGALPRLIVLNACSGATAEDVPFSGLAQGFLRQGVPAVVAMQASITDDAALIFTRYFYRDLVEIGAVDTSLTEARLRMQANGHPIEWGTPVLYMRALSGQLFQPIANPAPSPVEHAPPVVTPVKVDPPPSHVETMFEQHKKTRIRQEQKSAVPPSPKPAMAGKRKPKPMRDKENASAPSSPAAVQNMQSAIQPGPINSAVPPKPRPAAPRIAPTIPVAAPAPRPAPVPAPPANDVAPKVADKPAPLPEREPIVDEPMISMIPLIVPEVAAAFTLQPEPPPLSRPPESDMPQHTAAIREAGPVPNIHLQRTRIYALAGGGLVVAVAIGLGVNRDALFRSASSDPARREPTPAATAAGTLSSTAGTTSSTHTPSSSTGRAPLSAAAPEKTATPPPTAMENQARLITSGSGLPARDAPSTARAAKPAPATERSARRARVVKPPAAAPVDKCSIGEVSERSAECVLRAPTKPDAANEIPSGE